MSIRFEVDLEGITNREPAGSGHICIYRLIWKWFPLKIVIRNTDLLAPCPVEIMFVLLMYKLDIRFKICIGIRLDLTGFPVWAFQYLMPWSYSLDFVVYLSCSHSDGLMFELENGKPKLVLAHYGKVKFITYPLQICIQLFEQYFTDGAFCPSDNRRV